MRSTRIFSAVALLAVLLALAQFMAVQAHAAEDVLECQTRAGDRFVLRSA